MIEQAIRKAVNDIISDRVEKEIENRTEEFHNSLVARKDEYIAEIMKGIRIVHENNPEHMYTDYRIIFINKNCDINMKGKHNE